MGPEGSSWTINLEDRSLEPDLDEDDGSNWTVNSASISSNSRHIALLFNKKGLFVFNGSTGEYIGDVSHIQGTDNWRFSPDGCNVWVVDRDGGASVWRVASGWRGLKGMKREVNIEDPPEGYPWGSSHGYRVTDDWWILGPDGKRLLMLPPPWQYYAVRRIWKGRFLALLHGGLSKPVILELDE